MIRHPIPIDSLTLIATTMTHLFILTIAGRTFLHRIERAAVRHADRDGFRELLNEDAERIVAWVPVEAIVTHRVCDAADATDVAAALRAEFKLGFLSTSPNDAPGDPALGTKQEQLRPHETKGPWKNAIARLAPVLLALGLTSCGCTWDSLTGASGKIVVNTSAHKLHYGPLSAPVEISPRGTGHRIGSNKTPTGEFRVTKEQHRFGQVLRLSGYQGHRRGILIHRDLSRGWGTHGCIALSAADMRRLYALVPREGAELIIY